MVVSINQPAYLPWLGYFHRINISEIHVILDHVQFEKNSFVNRNKVRVKDGSTWLTVPVETSGKFGNLPINEVRIANVNKWSKKHMETFRQNYSKAPYFKDHFVFLENIYRKDWLLLHDIIKEINQYVLEYLEIKTKVIYSSSLRSISSKKSDLVFDICKEVGASKYISGPLGRNYLDIDKFQKESIQVIYDDFHPIEYQQSHPGFEPFMCIFDLMMNHGKASVKILNRKNGFHQ